MFDSLGLSGKKTRYVAACVGWLFDPFCYGMPREPSYSFACTGKEPCGGGQSLQEKRNNELGWGWGRGGGGGVPWRRL